MKTSIVTFALFLLLSTPAVRGDETKPGAGPGPAEKQVFMDFAKQQRQKSWDFEDKMMQKNRTHQDQERKAERDAELEDEATMSSSADMKAARKLIEDRRRERATARRARMEEFMKSNQQARKDFRTQMEAGKKAFHDAHPGPMGGPGGPKAGPGGKKPDKKKKAGA